MSSFMQMSMTGLALLMGGLSGGNLSINALSVNDITEEGAGSQPTEEGSSLVGSGSPGEQQQSPSSSGSGGLLSQIFKGKSVTNLSPVAQDMPAGSATSNYCVYACFEMILNKFGTNVSQQNVEKAAIYFGLSPGINQGIQSENIPRLGALYGLKNTELTDGDKGYPGIYLPLERAMQGSIFNDHPIMLVQPNASGNMHASVIESYSIIGSTNYFKRINPAGGTRETLPSHFYSIYTYAWSFYKQ